MTRKQLICSAGLALLPILAFSSAQAQEDDEGSKRLGTVTVTAAKKEQTLQETPIAVSVVDESVIENAGIQDLSDLQSLVPSLRVDTYQSSAQTSFKIRGFGNGDNNAGVEPSVAVYIDGVYRSRSAASIADLPNLQRVEVLRGPQSTLFGKNASAGVISIVTQGPQFQQEGNAEVTVGNYGLVKMSADMTGPLTDTIAYSLSGHTAQRDGYANDIGTGQDINDRNRWGARGQLLIEPNDDLSVRLIADYDEIDEICCIASNVINGPTGAIITALGGQLGPEEPLAYNAYFNFAPTNKIENSGISGQVDYEFDFGTLTSITSFRNSQAEQNSDGDFTTADLIGRFYSDTEIDTFTQEVRLAGTTDFMDWMVGGFYFDETVSIDGNIAYGTDLRAYAETLVAAMTAGAVPNAYAAVETALGLPVGTTFGQAGQGLSEEYGQDNEAYSLFGTLDFHLRDDLTLTLGANYTSDKKKAFANITNTDAFSALDFVSIGNTFIYQGALANTLAGYGIDATDPAQLNAFATANPAAFAQIQAGAQAFADANDTNPEFNDFLPLQALQFFPPFVDFPNAVENGESDDSKWTYTARLNYEVNSNLSVYGSYATGFKATSWNLSRDSRPFASDVEALAAAGLLVPNLVAGTRYAGPEDAKVFELGLKAAYDQVAFNVTVFDQEIEGFQSNAFTGTGFALTNAGVQSSTGVEADITWEPVDGLTLVAAGLFMDPVYDEFTNSSNGDISGQRPQSISENSLSLGASYDFVLPNGWDAYARADYQYESEAFLTDDPDTSDITREISMVNAAAGVRLDNGLKVSVWGRNIFDDAYLIEAFPSVAQEGSLTGYPNQPATYGVTVGMEF